MSAELLKKIAESKEKAKNTGVIIELRKSSMIKNQEKKSKISYKWYQTPTKVGIQIPYIVENKENLVVKFTKKAVTIDFPIKEGGNYHLDLELFEAINTAKSKKVHRLDSIEIIMEKQEQLHWLSLRKDGQTLPQAEEKQDINYPSSAKNKRNWDKIGKQLDRDIERHAQDYGEDPGMEFFKQIFRNADPDKRKAMMKSFQTSGGTVLSTDWDDVSKKDYEGSDRPSPPKGQEWKKRQL